MRQWNLEAGWFAVDGPCTPVPGSQLRKKVREDCLEVGILWLFAPSARIVVGAPWGTTRKPSWKGRSQAQLRQTGPSESQTWAVSPPSCLRSPAIAH